MKNQYDVIIIGAGPVGLFMGLRLQQLGLRFRILEKREQLNHHSRAIGIHPPSLELLEQLDAVHPILRQSISVNMASVYANKKEILSFDLSICSKPYNFIASISEKNTELILKDLLLSRAPNSIKYSSTFTRFEEGAGQVNVFYTRNDQENKLTCHYLVGCDGKNSSVRQAMNNSFPGDDYNENYIMGDFIDRTNLGSEASLFLSNEGVIESFPMPKNLRRWVVSINNFIDNPSGIDIANAVEQRLNITINPNDAQEVSGFKTHGLIAEHFAKNNILLAGDAACVVSPIGGQGMNLGWMNAWQASEAIIQSMQQPNKQKSFFDAYEKQAIKRCKNAILRAKFYRFIGRQAHRLWIKKIILIIMGHQPIKKFMANIVTMRYLSSR